MAARPWAVKSLTDCMATDQSMWALTYTVAPPSRGQSTEAKLDLFDLAFGGALPKAYQFTSEQIKSEEIEVPGLAVPEP